MMPTWRRHQSASRANSGLSVHPSWGKRIVGIEGLRGIAAISVLIVHVAAETALANGASGPLWSAIGQFRHGLTLFFVLSGFLLFRPFVYAVLGGKQRPTVGKFWFNRAIRIFPAYIVIVLLVSLILQTARQSGSPPDAKAEASGVLDWVDTLWAVSLANNLNPDQFRTGLGVGWSITVELSFYLILPLFGLAAGWIARKSGRPVMSALTPAVFMLLVGSSSKVWHAMSSKGLSDSQLLDLTWGHTWSAVFSHSLPMYADLFALGMAVAVLYVCFETERLGTDSLRTSSLAAMSILVLGVASAVLFSGTEFADTAAAAASSSLLVLAILPSRRGELTPLASLLESRFFVYLGLISYGVYLWHVPVIWWLQQRGLTLGSSELEFVINVLLVSALTVAASTLTYFGVEKQALKLKLRTDKGGLAKVAST